MNKLKYLVLILSVHFFVISIGCEKIQQRVEEKVNEKIDKVVDEQLNKVDSLIGIKKDTLKTDKKGSEKKESDVIDKNKDK